MAAICNLGGEYVKPLMLELNPSEQRCLPEFFYWGFEILMLTLRGGKKKSISHRLFLQI